MSVRLLILDVRYLCLALLLLLLGAPVSAAALTPVTQVEGISEYRLANGLRVLLAPDPSKPSTTVNITYLVGSRHENYGETGMAHLLEHLLFKGTPKNPDIDSEFTRRAMMSNATTWFDRTNYFETFPASNANLQWALQMEADRMLHARLRKADLESEMPVVRNEMEGGENDGFTILLQRMAATAYLWHNYGKDTIGARSDVEHVDINRLRAFYQRYYQPDNAVLVIAGRFDEARAKQWVAQSFGALPKPARKLPRLYTREPQQDGEREVTLRRAGDTQLLGALYHVPDGAHPDSAALALLLQVLGGTPNGRLHRQLVESGLASEISALHYALFDPAYVAFAAKASGDADAGKLRQAMLQVLEGVATQPVAEDELNTARAAWLNQFEQIVADPANLALNLSDYVARGDWRLFYLERDRVEALQAADLQRVAQAYLLPSNRTLGHFVPDNAPQRADIPPRSNPAAMLQHYAGKAAPTLGEAFDPTPAKIEARIQRSRLPGGLQLALLPKRNRGDQVTLALQLHFGDVNSLQGQATAGEAAVRMLQRGTQRKDRRQLAQALDQLRANLSIHGNAQGLSLLLQVRRSNLDATLTLLAEILRQPALAPAEFAQLQQEWLNQLAEARNDPMTLGYNVLTQRLDPYPAGDIRHVASFDEQIEAVRNLQLAQVSRFHADYFGAAAAQLAVIGEIDGSALGTRLQQLLGDWQPKFAYQRVPDPYRPVAPVALQLNTPDKASAWFSAALPLPLSDASADYPALLLANYVFGQGGGLNSRLMLRLRQQEGLSYGAGAELIAGSDEASGAWQMSASCAPQNFARLKAAFGEEFQRWVQQGISQQELRDARSGLLKEMHLARSDDAVLAGMLLEQLRLGRTLDFTAQLEKQLAALPLDQVNASLRRIMGNAGLLTVAAGDWEPHK
ncbi:MAG: hypothetical protein RL210_1114 [Pseudomonadota bacterium]